MHYMPPVTKNLLIINVLFFLGRYVASLYGIDLDDVLGLHFVLASHFHLYQVFTYMFMHASWAHIFFNMFAVWMFGVAIENAMGSRRYLLYYLTCGLGAAVTQEVVQFVQYAYTGLGAYEQIRTAGAVLAMGDNLNLWTTVGASGAVYGILLAFGMTFPDNRIFIFPLPVPIKAKYFVAGYAVIELLSGFGSSNDGVAHFAHLGGMLFGWLLFRYWRNRYNRQRTPYGNVFGTPVRRPSLWQRIRSAFGSRTSTPGNARHTATRQDDYNENMQRANDLRRMDEILDKITRSGYASLTQEEKNELYRISRK